MYNSTDKLHSFAQDIGPKLEAMNFKQQLFFALSCVERCLPFYTHFGRNENLNGLDELSATIEAYWGLSDFPAGALKRAIIPDKWEKSDKQTGVVSGETINLLMEFLNDKNYKIIQHVSDHMILMAELLTVKIGGNLVGEELELQKTALDDAEKMDTGNPESLNDYITRSIQIASNVSTETLTKLT